jgi:hypothetical protein
MRTQKMVMLIVLAIMLAGVAVVAGVFWWLGIGPGAIVVIASLSLLALVFLQVVRPWYVRWGATDEEAAMVIRGDELLRPQRSRHVHHGAENAPRDSGSSRTGGRTEFRLASSDLNRLLKVLLLEVRYTMSTMSKDLQPASR